MDILIKLLQGLMDGLSPGATYAIIAIGYTMVYGIAKMLNFAHGDVIMVGCYTVVLAISSLFSPAWGLLVAVVAAIVLCTLLGITMEKVAYKPLRGAPSLSVLITAIGISYLLQSVAEFFFTGNLSADKVKIAGYGKIGLFSIDNYTVLTILISASIMVALTLFIKFSRPGRAMVAVSEDRDAARLMGINTDAIITLTFAIGSALAAVAGWLMLTKGGNVMSTTGALPGIMAFSAAVIGGIGSIPGAMVGGVLLGLIEGVAMKFGLDAFVTPIQFALLILVLLLKPAGLLGKVRREKV